MNEKPIKKNRRRRRIVRRIVTLVIVLALLAGVGWYGYGMLKQEYTVTYDGYTATIGSISNSLSFSGNLQLIDSASYAASANASVRKVYVEAGQDVTEGDNLLRLSNGDTVKAEFDGRVNSLSVAEGDEVISGDALVQVADFTHLKVSFRVDEYDISDVHVGQECRVTVKALEETFDSTISHINRISSSMGNTAYYTVTAELSVTENVLPGMQATVTIPQEEAVDSVILSSSALSFAPDNSAYVLMKGEGDAMQQVPVTLGISNDSHVEITAGLKAGDEVYKVSTAAANAGLMNIANMFQSMGGQQQQQMPGGQMPGGSYGGGQMPEGGRGGSGSYGGGSRGNYGGGMR